MLVALLVALAAVTGTVTAEESFGRLLTVLGDSHQGTVTFKDGQFTVTAPEGNTTVVGVMVERLELSRIAEMPEEPALATVLTRFGDKLECNFVDLLLEDGFSISLPETGVLTMAYEKTKGILFHGNARSKSREAELLTHIESVEPELDEIALANGDKLSGAVVAVYKDTVIADVNGREIEIPVADLSYVIFTQSMLMPEDRVTLPADWYCAIRTTFGNRLLAHLKELTGTELKCTLLNGDSVTISPAKISTVEFVNGAAVKLTSLTPVAHEYKPWFVRTWPHRVDRSVTGKPLKVKGRLYENGIGTHAYTRLAYGVGKKFGKFRAVIGIDDGSGGMGSVVFRVVGDGKVLFESPLMKPGAVASVDVAIEEVSLLELITDFGGDDDLGDHADWCEPRLVKKELQLPGE